MSDLKHILALRTYGTKTRTHQGRRVSALKIGYTGPVAHVLLTLLPEAQDISSQRDRYVYIHVPNKPKLRQNWLFVEVNVDELQRVETLLREQDNSRGIAIWRESQWQLLPYRGQPDYQPARSRTAVPKGSPIGFWAINSAGEKGTTGGSDNPDQLIAEYSKLDLDKAAWWWLPGNDATYEQRFTLKRLGCRWVRRRRAYAYVGDRLPEGLLDLVDNAEECRAIMNGMTPDEARQTHRQREDQTVQADPSNENKPMTTSDNNPIQAVIQTLLSDIKNVRRPHPDRLPIILTEGDVVAGQTEVGQGVEKQIIWYLNGSSLSDEQRDRLKRSHATYSIGTRRWLIEDPDEVAALNHHLAQFEAAQLDSQKGMASDTQHPAEDEPPAEATGCTCETYDGPKGWYPAQNPGTWVACGTCNPTGAHLSEGAPNQPEAEGPPPIRLIKAATLPEDQVDDDDIQRAIRQCTQQAPQSATTITPSNASLQRLPMAYVGELTGSVVANVYCYGYAVDQGELIFLNMGGPRSGVEAIRAKLGKGDAVNLIPEDAPAIELTAGEGNSGMYSAIMSNISEARFTHCILVHEKLTDPNYNGSGRTYILQLDEVQAQGQLLHHIRETVSLPVFADWLDYLWSAGQTAMLVRSCRSGGGLTVKAVGLDPDSWQRLITGGVGQGIITIPPKSSPEPSQSGETTV